MSGEGTQSTEYQFSKNQIVWGLMAIFAVYSTVVIALPGRSGYGMVPTRITRRFYLLSFYSVLSACPDIA